MKPGSNRRPRSRPNNNNNNNKRQGGRNSYDSNGPDGKVRGTAQQVLEKYQALGRDATSAGDRIAAEAYFQYAEHYYRLVNADGSQPQPRRDAHQELTNVDESDSVETAPVPQPTVSEPAEPVIAEVVTVPIMPGPIATPAPQKQPQETTEQLELVAADDSSAAVPEVAASEEEKPKPVRRRRPRAKADTPKETEAEPAQA